METEFPILDRLHRYMQQRAGGTEQIPAPEAFDALCRDNGLSRETGFLAVAWMTCHARELHQMDETPGKYLNALNRAVFEQGGMHLPGYEACCAAIQVKMENLKDLLEEMNICSREITLHHQNRRKHTPEVPEPAGVETQLDDMATLEHTARWWLQRLEEASQSGR